MIPLLLLLVLAVPPASPPAAVSYRLAFPAPQHHYVEVTAIFPALPAGPLHLHMSRSSPGRYALHEYAKNVFDVRAFDGADRPLALGRPSPYEWTAAGHDGTVRVEYRVFGNRVDGTYLGIDASHAHVNMPPVIMWARGLEDRPVAVRFEPPPQSGWRIATQLFPGAAPATFTAPNLQYLMDSPAELSDHAVRSFEVRNPDGRRQTIVAAVHHDARPADVDAYAAGVERIVREQGAIFGEFPVFDDGRYTFLADYVPWGGGDGMEHRNSTVVARATSIRGAADRVLDTVSHEFFHAWNVERIRPASLEPFDFSRANMSGELWLAEGFTDYYGELVLARAGLRPALPVLLALANSALAVATHPGHRFRSPVDMSRMAAFADGAAALDPTNFGYSFINYYPGGAAVALALDLELRQQSGGRLSLDDYMRALWRVHGRPPAPAPGRVARPYTLADARERLAEVAGRAFADAFFRRHIEGHEVPDYAGLLTQAGIIVRRRHPGEGWTGVSIDDGGRVGAPQGLVPWGSPAFTAGLASGDTVTGVDGSPFRAGALDGRRPGDTARLRVRRVDGREVDLTLVFGEDPTLEAVPAETVHGTLSPAQQAFRADWAGSKRRAGASK